MSRVGLLLAAGTSRRFGTEDKLLAPLLGQPLVTYAAQAMRAAKFDRLIAVISNPALKTHLDGFDVTTIESSEQSASIRTGVMAAGDCSRLLIVLGDMPGITAQLLNKLLEISTNERASASRDTGLPMPPACFPASWLPKLTALTGDKGAGTLLRDLPAEALVDFRNGLYDIDTNGQLIDLEDRLNEVKSRR